MIKINMGCGWRNFGKEWIHIDGGNYSHLDYKRIDKLEFKENTIDLIYSSHVIEYFDRDEVIPLIKEWRRVLKPGGILRLAVPDFLEISKLYTTGTIKLNNVLGPLYGKMDMGSKKIYHKTAYDFESINNLLSELNFINIKKYDWRQTCHAMFDDHSQAYIPHMDKDNGKLISLNVQGEK